MAKGRAEKGELQKRLHGRTLNSVGDPDPQDWHVFGHPDPLFKGTVPDPSLFAYKC